MQGTSFLRFLPIFGGGVFGETTYIPSQSIFGFSALALVTPRVGILKGACGGECLTTMDSVELGLVTGSDLGTFELLLKVLCLLSFLCFWGFWVDKQYKKIFFRALCCKGRSRIVRRYAGYYRFKDNKNKVTNIYLRVFIFNFMALNVSTIIS